MNILQYQRFYLVGIKGVAMTALAQCLLDAGKDVAGCDVNEEFVTSKILHSLSLKVDTGFASTLSPQTECVVYTAAHQGSHNPVVMQAKAMGLPTYTHAQALADLFNEKQGIAVSGVGGKSTTSAMIAWILEKQKLRPSFAIGVGNIPGLNKTGQWQAGDSFFVAEADEYATDPAEIAAGGTLVPRFAYYEPQTIVCTNLRFDHPDVYRDFEHTQAVFEQFFLQLKPNGKLVVNADDEALLSLAQKVATARPDVEYVTFGESENADLGLSGYQSQAGLSRANLEYQEEIHALKLLIPGTFNLMNAAAAILACYHLGISLEDSCKALADFRSTQRRSEFVGEKHGVLYYDDYAHHPSEVQHITQAFRDWFPDRRLVIAFQSHTLSRTKSLFDQFAAAFNAADEVAMIDIFTSARETDDGSVTSEQLCDAIKSQQPELAAANFGTLDRLAQHLVASTSPGDVVLTVGAGDIYKVHDLIR